ncbi:MAG: hypothetical protein E4H38_03025, partial [Gemmatimonadales bacterium]
MLSVSAGCPGWWRWRARRWGHSSSSSHRRHRLRALHLTRCPPGARRSTTTRDGLATRVADQLVAHDALGAHARDELGIHEMTRARPIQAAVTSAASFAVGAAPPVALAAVLSGPALTPGVVGVTLILLLALGGAAA